MAFNGFPHVLVLATFFSFVPNLHGQVTEQQVIKAIDRGVAYLKKSQDRRGNWPGQTQNPGGVTALCTLALLNCGVPVDDPAIKKALISIRKQKANKTYTVALQTMVLCLASPEDDVLTIRANVNWLKSSQLSRGRGSGKGGWAYDSKPMKPDNSNSQFALLALYEAERVGIDVGERAWRLALNYWTDQQHSDGSWAYKPEGIEGTKGIGSMTCAGIASVLIASGQIGAGDASVVDGQVQCCGEQLKTESVERGLDWLARNFSVRRNPSPRNSPREWWLYYLYALERVGRLSGQRLIGNHDWYREGAEVLVEKQNVLGGWTSALSEQQPEIGTSLALLFLSKGRRAVLISKLKRPDSSDWNSHRHDVSNLTRQVERAWRRDMTWQTIDITAAAVEDFLQTPVLFISGRDSLSLTEDQKQNLKSYISQGGFIFAEAACGGAGFDKDFRALVAELFPDSDFHLLPPDHPVWYAEERVDPNFITQRPLLGLNACCRTSIVYCQGDLSCYWELSKDRKYQQFPSTVKKEIKACVAIGMNVITYATNRELKNKLDLPQVLETSDSEDLPFSTLHVAKLFHNGGHDDAPSAYANLLRTTQIQTQVRVSDRKRILAMTDDNLADYPIAFMHGRRDFRLQPAERKALATYIQNGGFLFADSICASEEFTEAFRRELRAVFPDNRLIPLRPDHPVFSSDFQGYDISIVEMREPKTRRDTDQRLEIRSERVAPVLEGIEIDGRTVVVFSPFDLSCALENQVSLECKGYPRTDAAKIGMNVILFAMQQ